MTADLAVVGGGIVGAFVAYEAGRLRPDWDIVVLERHAPGSGATAWSAGADFPIAATPGHRALVADSRARYADLRGTAAGAFLREVPIVYLLPRDRLERFGTQVAAVLRPLTAAERDRVEEMLPGLSTAPGEVFVTHDEPGAVVHARPLADALLSAAVGRGRTAVEIGQRVRRVDASREGYVLRAEGEWRARRVVLAPGPWDLPEPLPVALGDPPGARRKRIAALHARLPVRFGDPLVYFVADDLFVLPLAAGQALVSFRRDAWGTDPESVDGRADHADILEGTRMLADRLPDAAGLVTGGRAFCDLYTPDRLPVVLTSPGLPGLAAALGGSGSGVRLAPGLAARTLRAVI
ncbi:NAD(P)/FAD-dependent oxidoreductase [Sinosporangium album]|uniref:NAD(P)/FAD-dependent oxidoreductase n=1 Tax=Sinosporangium album TaxID=504805 RepID=UPI0015A42677|nr:FAD-binding oxidoreductase [Sinosporangium album]